MIAVAAAWDLRRNWAKVRILASGKRRIMLSWRQESSPRNRYYPCLVLRVVLPSGNPVNCIRVLRAPSHTEIGNSLQPKP